MQLTSAQKTTLKAHIDANTNTVVTPQGTIQIKDVQRDADHYDEVTAWYNALESPDYFIFKKSVLLDDVMANGFDWTVVDNETAGQARIWDRMLGLSRTKGGIATWKATVLRGVGEAYKGASGAVVAHRRNILRVHFPRTCRRWEKIFVADIGTDWNVGTNADKTGNRGTNTNPDIMPLDNLGEYLDGAIPKNILLDAAITG